MKFITFSALLAFAFAYNTPNGAQLKGALEAKKSQFDASGCSAVGNRQNQGGEGKQTGSCGKNGVAKSGCQGQGENKRPAPRQTNHVEVNHQDGCKNGQGVNNRPQRPSFPSGKTGNWHKGTIATSNGVRSQGCTLNTNTGPSQQTATTILLPPMDITTVQGYTTSANTGITDTSVDPSTDDTSTDASQTTDQSQSDDLSSTSA